MLRQIWVRNLAIVEHLELELKPGMTVFTGETGAGKSLLVDALGLVLGDRADAALVRAGAERAEVSAEFDISSQPEVQAVLEARGLDAEGECLISRQIGADGRSRAFVNTRPTPLEALRELGEALVDSYAQHAHHALLKRDSQRGLLDNFAGHTDKLEAVASDGLARLAGDTGDRQAQQALLEYQVRELEALNLQANEISGLEAEHKRLANLNQILESGQSAQAALDEGDTAVRGQLQKISKQIIELQKYDETAAPIASLLNEALTQLDEASRELRHYLDNQELDPARLQQIEQRLSTLHDTARKHRVGIEELPALFQDLSERLRQFLRSDEDFERLTAEQAAALADYQTAAEQLHASRGEAAKRLTKAVTARMGELGMPNGRFEIELSRKENDTPSPAGFDQTDFLVSANPGQPLRPLNKVASGGELSRISLAIQVQCASNKGVPTLVFDEVDVGIGGGVAEVVGRLLRDLGQRRQVLCVTHLAQVASLGHQHFAVAKTTDGKETKTYLKELQKDDRAEEIARMLGGLKITAQTLKHAKEMLESGRG